MLTYFLIKCYVFLTNMYKFQGYEVFYDYLTDNNSPLTEYDNVHEKKNNSWVFWSYVIGRSIPKGDNELETLMKMINRITILKEPLLVGSVLTKEETDFGYFVSDILYILETDRNKFL